MRVVNVGTEKALSALVNRITKAGLSKTARARVEAAILAANPGLDARRLTRGDVVRVPELPELLKSVHRPAPAERPDLFDRLSGLVEEWRVAAEATEEVAATERAERAKVVRDPSLKKAAEGNKDLAAVLDGLAAGSRQEADRARAAAKARAQRVEAMTAGLEAMRARLQ
jgi:hypothetical protein